MGDARVREGGRKGRVARAPRVAGEPSMSGGLAEVMDLLGGESDRSRRFLGGLIAGALVGAALAGSALLRRRSGERSG